MSKLTTTKSSTIPSTPIDAIHEFYKIKNNYETKYHDNYVKPIIKSGKSYKEQRIDFSKLPKPKCVNCDRNVGTVFTIRTDREEDVRKFIAKCGDLNDPCPLDIQINYSIRDQLHHTIVEGKKAIEELKMQIIKEKNNALFFRKDVVETFEKITEELKTKTESFGFAIETNILRNDNPEKYEVLKQHISQFSKDLVAPFKQMVANYMDQNNEAIIKEAIAFYIDEMLPKINEIQKLKYDVNYVEINEDKTHERTLIQYQNSLEGNEFFIKEDDKVIKYVRGTKRNNKTKKNREDTNANNANKTRKNKNNNDVNEINNDDEIGNNDELILIIRGHIRNSFENKNLYNFIKDIYKEFPNLKIFIHTWNVVSNNISWRKITANNQPVTDDFINNYFNDLSHLISHIIIDDDSKIQLTGNLSGNVCKSLIPTIGWKNYWYGQNRIMEYIYNNPDINKEDNVVNMRFDLFDNSNNFDYKNIIDFIKQNGAKNTNNANTNKNKFLFDYEKNGIDNIYIGSVITMHKLINKFNNDLDNIVKDNPDCQNPEKLVFRINASYV